MANSLLSEKTSPWIDLIIENQAGQKKETQSAGKIHFSPIPTALDIVIAMIIVWLNKPSLKKLKRNQRPIPCYQKNLHR